MTTPSASNPASPSRKQRIVLTTFGSLGDLHPYIAMALELRARGHDVVLATCATYRAKIEALGIGFRPLRPDMPDWQTTPERFRYFMHQRLGTLRLIREFILPVLRESYEDTRAAAAGADLLVSHGITFSTRIVAEQLGIPWASTVLQPMAFMSPYDPPLLPALGPLTKWRSLGPAFFRPLFRFGNWTIRNLGAPLHRLRADAGLPFLPGQPLIDWQHSPRLVLALYSGLLGGAQPDWPAWTRITGFSFYDQDGAAGLEPELARFLASGPPPIVFTLGSTAVLDPGRFYDDSIAAATKLGRRALLLVGRDAKSRPAHLPAGTAAFEYAPYSDLFPRAAVIVHQGGIGTTGQALRSGRPMLVVPFAHDQPDNGARVRRLGVARVIPRHRYGAARAAAELSKLLDDPAYAAKAATVADSLRQGDGTVAACDALEETFALGY